MLSALLWQLSTGSLLLYCTAKRKDCVTLYKFHCSYSLLPPPHCSTVLTDIKGGNVLKEGESCGKETVTSAGKCPRFFSFFFEVHDVVRKYLSQGLKWLFLGNKRFNSNQRPFFSIQCGMKSNEQLHIRVLMRRTWGRRRWSGEEPGTNFSAWILIKITQLTLHMHNWCTELVGNVVLVADV